MSRAVSALLVLGTSDSSEPVLLASAYDLNVGFMWRSTMKEGILFTSRVIAKRAKEGQLQSFEQDERYRVYSCVTNGLCALAFVDPSYPMRTGFSLLREVVRQYVQEFGNSWQETKVDQHATWPFLESALKRYQDPLEADKLLKIQKDLDETVVILNRTIQDVLKRGETLDALVERSSDLSQMSRTFYKQAKKTNQCCNLS